MFSVPELDDRLGNKDEVLALRFPEAPASNSRSRWTSCHGDAPRPQVAAQRLHYRLRNASYCSSSTVHGNFGKVLCSGQSSSRVSPSYITPFFTT